MEKGRERIPSPRNPETNRPFYGEQLVTAGASERAPRFFYCGALNWYNPRK
jgi:hypothetical protein